MTLPDAVAAFVSARRLERVPADRVYAEALLHTPSAAEFQRMRRRRNKAEYDDITVGRADLDADLAHAAAMIEAVRLAISPPGPADNAR